MVTQNQNKFRQENIKSFREAAPADEEATATFPVELKRLIRVLYYLWFQASTRGPPIGGYIPKRDYCILLYLSSF